jgi:hypothetical protein
MKLAIQGERGAFSHQAALCPVRDVLPCATSVEVFDAIESRRATAINRAASFMTCRVLHRAANKLKNP